MSYFGKLWAMIRGLFIRAGDELVSSSPEAIRSTYAAAINDAKKEAELQRKLEGALAAAEADPANASHREAGARYLGRMKEIVEKKAALATDLEGQRGKVEEYKTKLRSFTTEIERLKREQGEMVAEFVSNQQVLQLEDRLRGLADTAVDESIVAIRDKVASLRAQAKIASEMRTAGSGAQDETYERIGAEKEAAARFDELLKARTATKEGVTDKQRDLG
jgi:chromosome segregation ATPase